MASLAFGSEREAQYARIRALRFVSTW